MRLLCLADIHCRFAEFMPDALPAADVCLVAGDLTNRGFGSALTDNEVMRASLWLKALAEHYPVLWVPGNHDIGVHALTFTALPNVVCLLHNPAHLHGLSFWGESLCTAFDMPELASNWAYTTANVDADRQAWQDVPRTDVIVSHCPPFGVLDMAGRLYTPGEGFGPVRSIGSPGLRAYIERHTPRLVVCGHAHGQARQVNYGGTGIVNTAETWTLIELD